MGTQKANAARYKARRMNPKSDARWKLRIAESRYRKAVAAKAATREALDEAVRHAAAVGLPNAVIGREIGVSGQRVGHIVAGAGE